MAVTQTLSFLVELQTGSRRVWLSGQNLGHAHPHAARDHHRNVTRLHQLTGQWPALLGADYGYNEIAANLRPVNTLLQSHHQEGGLVTISMHPSNPWRMSNCHDTRVGPFAELTTPGTPAFRRWRASLDRVAGGLAELRDAGVIVLWRPLHEMNGGWFWWGAERNGKWVPAAEFVALWRDMFHYFTQVKQLDNLLWVYAAAVQQHDRQPSVLHYYPGHDYVDVVGWDWYSDTLDDLDLHGSYTQLLQLGKPTGLTEFGPRARRDGAFDNSQLLATLKSRYPKCTFFVYWHSWRGARMAIIDHRASLDMMRDEQTLTRDDLARRLGRLN